MHARDRNLKHLRLGPPTAVTVAVSIALFCANGADAAMIKKCPSPKALQAAAGTSLTIRTSKAGMDVFCDYTHRLSATLQDNVNLSVEPLGESASALESTAKANAKGLKATFKNLSGIGDAAWECTEPKSKLDAGGAPTTTVTIVVGKREVTVISNLPSKNVLAIAKLTS